MDSKYAAISISHDCVRPLEHARHGARVSAVARSSRRCATRPWSAVARGELRGDAVRCPRAGETPAVGRVDGDRPAAVGPGGRCALLAKTRTDCQGPRVCRRTHGAADGDYGGYLPIVLPMLLPGVSVNPAQIARSLVLLMLLPLAGALVGEGEMPDTSPRRSGRSPTRRRT